MAPGPSGVMAGSSTRLLLPTLDQVVSSLGNFVLVFSLAHTASPGEFGVYALGVAVLSFALAIGRSVIATPFTIDSIQSDTGACELSDAHPETDRSVLVSVARSSAFALIAGAVMAAILSPFVAVAAWRSVSLAQVLALFLVALPLLMLQDFLRYVAVARSRPSVALVSDGSWTAILLGLFCYQILAVRPADARVCAGIWVLGLARALAVLVVAGLAERPRARGLLGWVGADRRHAQLAGDALLSGGGPIVFLSLVGLVSGTTVVAALRGASTVFGPFNTLLNALTLALVPEVRRRRHARGGHLLVGTTAAVGGGVLVFGLVVALLLPENVGAAVLGDTWPLTRRILLATAVEYVGITMLTAGIVWCRAKNRVDVALRLQAVQWAALLLAGTLCSALFGTARAVAVGIAIAGVAAGTTALITARRLAYEE
jgi:hypothetical protein